MLGGGGKEGLGQGIQLRMQKHLGLDPRENKEITQTFHGNSTKERYMEQLFDEIPSQGALLGCSVQATDFPTLLTICSNTG